MVGTRRWCVRARPNVSQSMYRTFYPTPGMLYLAYVR